MSDTARPLVSAIVLCYNQSRYVRETLASVKAQTYPAVQLILVDDCSADDSVPVIERWLRETGTECEFIRHRQNQGICKSLNEALTVARGKYISMTAADDLWLPDKLARQVEIMDSESDHVGVLYSDAFQIDERGQLLPEMFIAAHRKLPEMPQGRILDTLLVDNFIPGMTALIRRSCYDRIGLYDETLPWEDWDMWLRIARRYSFLFSPAPSAKYRVHDKSLTHSNQPIMAKGGLKIILKQFAMGDLTGAQKTMLVSRVLYWAEEMYRANDPEASDLLLAAWHATGQRRTQWMYRFQRCGLSFHSWQRADSARAVLKSFRS